MSEFFSLLSKAPGASELVIVSGPPFSPWVLAGQKDLSGPSWQHQFSGPRGTQGRRAAAGQPDDRTMSFGLLSEGHDTKDALATDLSAMVRTVDEMRRFGGWVTFREFHQTYRQRLECSIGAASIASWDQNEFNVRDTVRPLLTFTGAPYLQGDPMDISGDFTTDGLTSDFTVEAGDLANLTVVGGALTGVASLSTENRLIHTGRGYLMGDLDVTVKVTPGSTITGFKAGLVGKSIDSTHRLEAYVTDTGSESVLVTKLIDPVNPATSSNTLDARVTAGVPFWVRLRLANGVLTASYFAADPRTYTPTSTGDKVAMMVLQSQTAGAEFGRGIVGRAGLIFLPKDAAASLSGFSVEPFPGVRAFSSGTPAVVEVRRFDGLVPGDAPALADITIRSGYSGASFYWGLAAWWRRPSPYNLLFEGGFQGGFTTRWSKNAVTGITGAATSITVTASSTAKYGTNVGRVVTPATANVGATIRVAGQFIAGETYTGSVYVRAPSGATTAVRLRVGDPASGGSVVSSTAVALTSGWVQHTVTWQVGQNATLVYLCVEQTAATASTFDLDGAVLYLGTDAPTGGHAQGNGARPPFGVLEAEDRLYGTATETTASGTSGGLYASHTPVSGGDVFDMGWMLDPALVSPDDYSDGGVGVSVWARVMLNAAHNGGVQAVLSAYPEGVGNSNLTYTSEFGSMGATLIPPVSSFGWRWAKLGTLTLPGGRDTYARWILDLVVNFGSGTNAQPFGIDCLVLVPTRNLVAAPTGKTSAGYPYFLPFPTAGLYPRRRLNADGTSDYALSDQLWQRANGYGQLIEVPSGQLEALAITGNAIPDSPNGTVAPDATTESFPTLHLSVTPRWSFLRETS